MKNIKIESIINKDLQTTWQHYNDPDSVTKWNQASKDWYCPKATNKLEVGSKFSYTMSAKDNSTSFDFSGTYTKIENFKSIAYTLDDNRKVTVDFEIISDNSTKVTLVFEPETENNPKLQQEGWQAILDSFKDFVEKTA